MDRVTDGDWLLSIKPMQHFLPRLDERLRRVFAAPPGAPIRIAIVGGGAGGVEVALCVPPRIERVLGPDARFELTLVTADPQLPASSLASTARRMERILSGRDARLVKGRRVVEVAGPAVTLDDGTVLEADLIVWVAGAAAPPLLARLGLPTDARGYLLTRDTLQSTSGAPVFAVGDTGTIAGVPTLKAGVYAVRQGPVLWANIQRALSGAPSAATGPNAG